MEKDLQEHYESITGRKPKVVLQTHKESKKGSIKVFPDKDEIHYIAGNQFRPDKNEVFGIVTDKVEDHVKDQICKIHEKYTGKRPKSLEFTRHDDPSKANLKLGHDYVVASGHLKHFSPRKLEIAYAGRFHNGIQTTVYGDMKDKVKRKIYTTLSMAISKLSKKNKEKIKGAKVYVYSRNHPETPAAKDYLLRGLQRNNSEEDKKVFKDVPDIPLAAASPARKEIFLVSPDTSKDLMRMVSHELHHLIEDRDKLVKPFTKTPLTKYAKKYTDPVKRSRESMADLFGHFIKYRSKKEHKTKHPTDQIVGFIKKVFPGKTDKESRFKRYLIRKLHILSGTPLPQINIKKPPQ